MESYTTCTGNGNNLVVAPKRRLYFADGYGKVQKRRNTCDCYIALDEYQLFNQLYGTVGTYEQSRF